MISLWPPAVRHLLDGSATADSGEEPPLQLAEQAALRRDVLMGHLLRLATRGGGNDGALPPHALPAMAEELVAAGLMPRLMSKENEKLIN
jgi:hypothetical protein